MSLASPARRPTLLAPATLAISLLAACGGRSSPPGPDLGKGGDGGTSGGGGSTLPGPGGGTSTSNSTSTTTSTTEAPECFAFTVSPVEIVPTPGDARWFTMELLPPSNHVLVTYIEGMDGLMRILRAGSAPAFAEWPPALSSFPVLTDDIDSFVTGPGPDGPVAVLTLPSGENLLAPKIYPDLTVFDFPFATSIGAFLFATSIEDSYLAAQSYEAPDYDVLSVSSYQSGSLPQGEQPLVCQTSEIHGAAVPSGAGFLAAFTEPNSMEPCNPQSLAPGTILGVARYGAESGDVSLTYSVGAKLDFAEPLVHVAMAPASFGAWLVFQTDGSTSETQPPVYAAQIDTTGNLLAGSDLIALTPGGYQPPDLAVAALGDTLAFAHIDAIDPSAPTVVLQLVTPDGQLGPTTSIPTNDAWYYYGLRLLASPAGNSLLVGWETYSLYDRIALTRVDCVGGL